MTVSADEVRIERAAPCGRCGYDLRGAAADGVCPECGLGVAVSTAARRGGSAARPAWLGRVSVGTWLLLVAAVADWPAVGVTFSLVDDGRVGAGAATIAAYAAVRAAAVWLATSGDRRAADCRPLGRRRRAARGIALLLLPLAAGMAGTAARSIVVTPTGSYVAEPTAMSADLGVALYVAWTAGWVVTILYLRAVAVRAGRPRLAANGRGVAVGLAVAAVALPAAGQVSPAVSSDGWLYTRLVVTADGLFVVGWTLLLLGRFAVVFWGLRRRVRRAWWAADAAAGGAVEREGQ